MEPKDAQRDVRFLRAFVLLFSLLSLIVLTYFVSFPMANLIYVYPRAAGDSVDNRSGFGRIPVTIFFVVNYLVLLLAVSVVADPNSPARVDLHQLATTVALIGNLIVFFICFGYYFFWINSIFAGSLPFNDDRWACVYYGDKPSYSPTTLPCVTPNNGLAGHQLSPNVAFKVLWIFSVVFGFFAMVQRVFNMTLRRTGAVVPPSEAKEEGEILGFVVNGLYLGIVTYWCSTALLNTIHTHGFPTLGIPPGPGTFQSVQYNGPYTALALLCLNIIPPLVFCVALAIRTTQFWHMIHLWTTIVVGIVTTIVLFYLIVLLIPVLGYCNSFNSAGSICNDYQWCCNHFADAPEWCNNVTPCPSDPFLVPNGEYVAHLIYGLSFVALTAVELWLNYRMQRYGVFASI